MYLKIHRIARHVFENTLYTGGTSIHPGADWPYNKVGHLKKKSRQNLGSQSTPEYTQKKNTTTYCAVFKKIPCDFYSYASYNFVFF
jgi:hypothetical protein